jgi:hypothetical protein
VNFIIKVISIFNIDSNSIMIISHYPMSIYLLCLLIPSIINPYEQYDAQYEYKLLTYYRTLLLDPGKGTTYYSVLNHVL